MASLMENLIDILEKEITEYKALLELSKRKTPIIVKGDIVGLQTITEEEQAILGRLNHQERIREEVMKDVANVLNKDVNNLKLRDIIKMLEKRPAEQQKLAKAYDGLSTVVASVSSINEQNKMLIKQQMEMVEFDMNLIKSMNSAPETAGYDRTAGMNGSILGNGSGSFDAKQ